MTLDRLCSSVIEFIGSLSLGQRQLNESYGLAEKTREGFERKLKQVHIHYLQLGRLMSALEFRNLTSWSH
jgi:hypothetical protein